MVKSNCWRQIHQGANWGATDPIMYLRRGNDLLMIAHWQVNFEQFAYLLQGLNKNGTNETFAMAVRDKQCSYTDI